MRSKLERRQVVEETMQPGAPSVAVIARAHGVNANQVFNWRKLYQAGRLDERRPRNSVTAGPNLEDSRAESLSVERPAIAPGAVRERSTSSRGESASASKARSIRQLRTILEQLGQ